MKEINIVELYRIKNRIIKEGMEDSELMEDVLDAIKYREDLIMETSATGGAVSGGGMGAVVSAQPSGLAGQTIGTSWASGGGTEGSDISVPYNPSGVNRMMQKIPVMGKNHGSRTGKKSRKKRLDMKTLRNVFSKRQDFTNGQGERKKGEKKVMNFNDFVKNDITKIKK